MLVALTTDQQVGLATTAAIFIAFSLLAALVIPRANPDFPGRRGLVPFIIVTLALTIAMLGAVEVWAKEDHAAAEGAHETTPTEPPPPAEPPPPPGEPPPPTTTGAGEPSGSAQAGRAVFVDSGCGNCHTFQPAGTTGTVGPDLSEVLAGQDAAFIRESIVDPNAEIASGYSAGVMPETYEDQLSPQQLNDLVAFLASG